MALLNWESCFTVWCEETAAPSDRTTSYQHMRQIFTIKPAISLFSEALRDPMRPQACARCLLGTIGQCRLLSKQDKFTGSVKPFPRISNYFDTAITLLMSPKVPEDVDAALSRFSDCRCTMTTSSVTFYAHLMGEYFLTEGIRPGWTPKEPATILIVTLCRDIADALDRANVVKTAQEEQVKRWPNSIDAVFPPGFRAGARCLAWWQNALKADPACVLFIQRALRLCGEPLSYEVRNSAGFRDAFLSTISETVSQFRRCNRSLEEIDLNSWRLNTATELLNDVGGGVWDRLLLSDWFPGELGVTLSQLLLDAALFYLKLDLSNLSNADLGRYSEIRDMFVAFALQATEKLAKYEPQVLQWREINERWEDLAGHVRQTDLDARTVAAYLVTAKRGPACQNEGCIVAIEHSKRSKMYCSACKMIPYCSKECQKRDWSHRRYPHRAVCKQIQIFVEACGGDFALTDVCVVSKLSFEAGIAQDATSYLDLWNWIKFRKQLM